MYIIIKKNVLSMLNVMKDHLRKKKKYLAKKMSYFSDSFVLTFVSFEAKYA